MDHSKLDPKKVAKAAYVKAWHEAHPGYRETKNKEWKKARPGYFEAKNKAWKEAHPDYRAEWELAHPGYSTAKQSAWRKEYLESKAGRKKPKRCDVCKKTGRIICFDHCHKSQKFRGWICSQCNVTLGYAGDSPELLRKLADYLDAAKQIKRPRRLKNSAEHEKQSAAAKLGWVNRRAKKALGGKVR